ncbi:MAG TPA: ornithine carbamoyltransferase [Ktedonobacteraceae bacterium]|jgi:ornithine carbamoyltransferase|nr:ornithine carbamoyltransferase [Ktedonobacteraceae bacterium]
MIDKIKRDKAFELAEQRFRARMKRKPRSFLSLEDLKSSEMKNIIHRGIEMKNKPGIFSTALHDMSIALLFQKTSTRTRCSFENAAVELGAFPSYIDWKTSNFVLADLCDEVKVLSRYYDLIVARVLKHETLAIMAQEGEVPVVNGMCDREHPCQALSDFMTITEYFGDDLDGLRIAYLGDGNNVCRSLVHGAIHMGVQVNLCSPEHYALDDETVAAGKGLITRVTDPIAAVSDADIIYTDTWVSIGDEAEMQERISAFKPYQINAPLIASAPSQVLFMHCLPAHPDQEVTSDILRSSRSLVFDQAENRGHTQKALLEWLANQQPA